MDQKILIDSVKVEEEDQANEPSHGLRKNILRVEVLMSVSIRKKKGGESEGEQKGDDSGSGPEPPFAALDAAKVRADVVGLRASAMANGLWLMRVQESPSGAGSFAQDQKLWWLSMRLVVGRRAFQTLLARCRPSGYLILISGLDLRSGNVRGYLFLKQGREET